MTFYFSQILARTSTQYKLWFISRHNWEILMTKITLAYAVFIFLTQAYLVSAQAATKQVTLMTYNVENLFDLTHDRDKNDYAYMPYIEKRNNKTKREKKGSVVHIEYVPVPDAMIIMMIIVMIL